LSPIVILITGECIAIVVMVDGSLNRRSFVKLGIGSTTVGLAGCLGTSEASDLVSVPYFTPDDKMTNPLFMAASEDGIWEEYGIDFQPNFTSYGRSSRSLTDGEADIGHVDQATFLNARNNDEDIVLLGPMEKLVNGVFTNADSDIDGPEDLVEQRVGVPFWDSGTTMLLTSMWADEYGFDVRDDTDATATEPPVLWELMTEQDEFDAIMQFTNWTITARTRDDVVREIFDPAEFWEERTGHVPMITYHAARRSWLEEDDNAQLLLDFLDGWSDAIDHFNDNSEEIMDRYGRLGQLEDDDERELVSDILRTDGLPQPATWDEEFIENEFELLDLIGEYDFVDEVPTPEEGAITYEELQSMA